MVYLDQCGLDEHWVKLREKQTTLSVGGSGEDVISGGGRTDLTVGLLPADGYTWFPPITPHPSSVSAITTSPPTLWTVVKDSLCRRGLFGRFCCGMVQAPFAASTSIHLGWLLSRHVRCPDSNDSLPGEGLLQIGRGRIFLRGEYNLCSVSVWKLQKRLWYLGPILIIAQPSLFEFMISDVNCGLKDSTFCWCGWWVCACCQNMWQVTEGHWDLGHILFVLFSRPFLDHYSYTSVTFREDGRPVFYIRPGYSGKYVYSATVYQTACWFWLLTIADAWGSGRGNHWFLEAA